MILTCPPVVNDVVDFPNVAGDPYSANLNEFPPGLLKLCVPSNNSFLKELQIALVVIAIFFSFKQLCLEMVMLL